MTFFFDVWMRNNFVLASDVRLNIDGEYSYMHKIQRSPQSSKISCAIVVCGDYPETCLRFFQNAIALANSLREVAKYFARDWTKRFAGHNDYSAVHLVGFENYEEISIPQMWYWHNWENKMPINEKRLQQDLQSFSLPVPKNNHIPWKIRELGGSFKVSNPLDEFNIVNNFLTLQEPIFSWNGDNNFWASAATAIGSAMNILAKEKDSWPINDVIQLTVECLRFLSNVGNILPDSSVGPSPTGQFDILVIKPNDIYWHEHADF